jgi:TrmH family RNA methyltransferase
MLITSPHNPRIKALAALRDRRARDQAALMRVEGYEELSLALESGAQPVEVYYCPVLIHDPRENRLLDIARAAGAALVEVSDRVFEKIAYRDNPDGWLATFKAVRRGLDGLKLGEHPFLLVCEAVEKPGNLGAMLRTADAAGLDALIACDPLTDWGNPNVIRASKGALFTVQVADAPTPEALAWLKAKRIKVVVASPDGWQPYTRADLRGPVAVVVGAEHQGVGPAWLAGADLAVQIPMAGRVNSLNVATAAALIMYEVVRQRAAPYPSPP